MAILEFNVTEAQAEEQVQRELKKKIFLFRKSILPIFPVQD